MWRPANPDKEKSGYHKISKTRRSVVNVKNNNNLSKKTTIKSNNEQNFKIF